MPPSQKRQYPGLSLIKDNPTQQAIKQIWDLVHDHSKLNADGVEAHDANVAEIAALRERLEKAEKQVTLISAGGGIVTRSSVGGGGSGGASGGSGSGVPGGGGGNQQPPTPPPSSVPDLTALVQQAKDDLVAALVTICCTECDIFQIAKLFTWRAHVDYPELGLLDATGHSNCNGYSPDKVAWKPQSGPTNIVYVFDILIGSEDPAQQVPTWSFVGVAGDPDEWLPPIPGAIP